MGIPFDQLLGEHDVHQLGVAVSGRGETGTLAVKLAAGVEQVLHVLTCNST